MVEAYRKDFSNFVKCFFLLLICLVVLILGESFGVTLCNLATILIDIIILGNSFINLY